jgi:histidinol-phosphate aminotransferase
VLAQVPGLLVVDEAYGQFADWSALDLLDEETPLVVTRTFSKTWSMAGSRLGYLVGPRGSWPSSTRWCCRTTSTRRSRSPVGWRSRSSTRWNERVQLIVSERERIQRAIDAMPVDHFPSGANFMLFRPRTMAGPAGVAGPARPQRPHPRLLGLAAARRLPARHHRHPDENDAFLTAPSRRSSS